MKKTKNDKKLSCLENKSVDPRILDIRKSIDGIDEKIVSLLNKRLLLGEEVGKVKEESGNRVLDAGREKRIKDHIKEINDGPMDDSILDYIFSVIMAASRELQKPQVIAYLGPEATYTHLAAMDFFGHSGTFLPKQSIYDVFEDVESGSCKYGVVPIENSIEGSVTHSQDLLFNSDLNICAEIYQDISHDLISLTGNIEDIKIIYSHPQPVAQSRKWLRKNVPDAIIKDCNSTAEAAKKAMLRKDAAAIASSKASVFYSMNVIASGIEDYVRNVTRFLIISKDRNTVKTGHDKTSIVFVTSHHPGALYHSLAPLAEAELNMVKLESRPTKLKNWDYFFLMDIEGHIEDKVVVETVDKMKKICSYLKILGSYKIAEK